MAAQTAPSRSTRSGAPGSSPRCLSRSSTAFWRVPVALSHVAPRTEVCPPALQLRTATFQPGRARACAECFQHSWQAASRDLADIITAGGRANGSPKVRDEFMQAFRNDIRTVESGMVQERVRIARCCATSGICGRRSSDRRIAPQPGRGRRRLDRLNRHFPTRSPRSGFAPLDGGGSVMELRPESRG